MTMRRERISDLEEVMTERNRNEQIDAEDRDMDDVQNEGNEGRKGGTGNMNKESGNANRTGGKTGTSEAGQPSRPPQKKK